jgi:hypothetical protein
MHNKLTSLALLLIAPLFVPTFAHADHSNLEEGLPVEVEDAYPIEYKGREIQGQARYERNNGTNLFVLQPSLEYGFARNWQGKISVPFRLGNGDKTGSGDVGLEAFYNFNTESLSLPAFAVSARADVPTGRNSSGVDTQLKFIASKTLGSSSMLNRLHLNLIYRHNAKAQAGERTNRYAAILGYSRRMGPDTIFVTDLIHEQERMAAKTSNIAEIGVRRQITPLLTVSLGAGVGLNKAAPNFRLTTGVQKSF